jgi:hypothetical protein
VGKSVSPNPALVESARHPDGHEAINSLLNVRVGHPPNPCRCLQVMHYLADLCGMNPAASKEAADFNPQGDLFV